MINPEIQHKFYTNMDLGSFGIDDIAFIKTISVDGKKLYAIHAADGTPLTTVAEREVAIATVRQHDMDPLSVH